MSIGINIRKRRFELGMTQQELAQRLGYKTRSTIAKIESGENDITQKKLQRFAEALDTTTEQLITGQYESGISNSKVIDSFIKVEKDSSIEHQDKIRKVAIILAGGKSIRNQQNIPSQFINILGKPVIMYCLEAYEAHPSIDDIFIVCLKGWEQIVMDYAKQYHISKLRGLIPAANSGILSAKNGYEYVKDIYNDNAIIIFQESNRPMVTTDMISKLLQACYEQGSAHICYPMRDYVQFEKNNEKASYIDRNSIVDLQSPEAYRLYILKDLFETAEKQKHELAESCCVLLKYNLGLDINLIEGSPNNIKIIRQEDITILAALLRNRL